MDITGAKGFVMDVTVKGLSSPVLWVGGGVHVIVQVFELLAHRG